MNIKLCRCCNIEKPTQEFYKRGKSSYQYRCKDCTKNHIVTNEYDDCPECKSKKRKNSPRCSVCTRSNRREIYSDDFVNRVLELYADGKSTIEIAKILNTYKNKINRAIVRSGNKLRSIDEALKRGENSSRWNGHKEISGAFFNKIQKSAKSRGHEFCITIEYIYNLYIAQNKKCNLSGLEISLPDNSTFCSHTASLDRIDSSKGYVEGNVQWVHKWINRMKSNLAQDEFIYLCRNVSITTKNEEIQINKIDTDFQKRKNI